ncbi:MAG: molybdopterin-dependent oxidoreductase [Myxococcales bacterium]|nr:molybdopterin-dependent oxidoreductase [Myxococcales bacterium]
MTETHHTFCRICEALCGLEVQVDDGKVTQIRPNPRHVATQGFGCVKGMNQHLLYDSPDRLKTPLRREGDRFVPCSWEEALRAIGAAVARIRGDHDPDAIAMYVGTAAGFGVLHPIFAQGFMTAIGSKSMYSSATQDCANKFAVAERMYGFCFTQPYPDLERVRCLIIVGANPAVSKWSFLQVPNPVARLKELERRGGRLFIVDPRRTETARAAGEHVFIRPGADVYFYLSFLHALLAEGVDRARIDAQMVGLAALEQLAAAWPPERTAEVTGIPAATLRAMVTAYREADGAALYSSTGVNMGGHGALSFWLQEAINAISGNLDRPGGTLVGEGVIDFPRFAKRRGLLTRHDRSRIGGFRSVNDAFPGAILADEILTPGPKQVRALFVTGGNPLLTMANGARLREALAALELLVVTDLFLNETASLAHYVLPATSPLQRPDLPFIFPLMLGLQSRPYLQATRPVVAPEGEQRDEATIYLDLCRASGVHLFGSRVAQRTLELARRAPSRRRPRRSLPQERLLDLLLRVTGQGGFRRLLREPHGRPRPRPRGGDFLGRRVLTDDGKVALAPAELVARARRRFRVQHWGRHAQIVDGVARALALDALPRRALPAVAVGVAVDVAPPAAPQRRAGTSPRAVSVNAAWRRSWAARARRASSRTPHGFGREPAHRVVTFGIDGPRLLPLTLFD